MREWPWRLAAMWRRENAADERADELRFHFEMEVEAARARGLSVDDARRHARGRVGSVPQAVVTAHEAAGIRWMDTLGRDMRQAARALRRDPGFSVVAALVLTSSVAVATLVFVIFDAVLLRPLPYPAPERLVRVFDVSPTTPRFPMAIGRYLDYRQQARSLDELALYTGRDVELSGDGPGRPV